jgi:Flp pilus assembly protein TadD
VLAARSGRTEEARRLFSLALETSPADPDTLFNLGTVLWREGRRDEARPYLQRFLASAPPALYAPDIARIRSWLAHPG